jgi:PAS domain-containing protein
MTALARTDPPASPQSTRFCSRCGGESAEAARRVCESCEAGILLSCRSDALPGAAFLICTYELSVTAVSEAGENIFGAEDGLLGTNLLDLATCPLGDEQLARHTALAAQRAREPVELPMRLRSEKGETLGTLAARVTTCGPPRAAVVTVEPTGFGRR